MKIFTDKNIKTLFCRMLVCLLVFVAASLLILYFNSPNTALYILICALLSVILILAFCFGYFYMQNKTIENASGKITDYISGNKNARIDCNDEGELYKLFHKINSLASILNANAENEFRSREFLKNTISDISHQLKTPLAALNIYNGILQTEADNADTVKQFADLSEQELDRIEALVQSLLKITRLDAGAIVIEKSPENVSDMMKTVKKHFAFRAEQEKKQIILIGSDEVFLPCDRSWLVEAIDNIVKNALDHTKAGDTISIEWKSAAASVRISIKDSGCGIHPEDINHIFKRFYRSRFSKDKQGLGLGLPLAKTIIEAHGGSITVDSAPGNGAEFTINFLIPTKL